MLDGGLDGLALSLGDQDKHWELISKTFEDAKSFLGQQPGQEGNGAQVMTRQRQALPRHAAACAIGHGNTRIYSCHMR
jgi:hypothetical protein